MKMGPLPPILFIFTDAYHYVRYLEYHLGWERHNYNNSKGSVFGRLNDPLTYCHTRATVLDLEY